MVWRFHPRGHCRRSDVERSSSDGNREMKGGPEGARHSRGVRDGRGRELARCHECFFGPDDAYHQARRRFVYKLGEADAGTPRSGIGARDPGRLDLGGAPDRRRRRSSGSVVKR